MQSQKMRALSAAFSAAIAIACCRSVGDVGITPDPEGILLQRRLIGESFAGTDIRSDPRARADFENGARDAVSVAWWGFDETDATGILQACFHSGARIILVPNMGKPWVAGPLFLDSDTTLLLEEGVEIHAKKGSFQEPADSLFTLRNLRNVTLYGYGARLKMRKEDYRRPPYRKAEWRHAFKLHGCTGIALYGVTAESSGGDGVYLGTDERKRFNENIILKDLVLRDHYRQGISVISAQGLLIENVEMSFTEGTLPSAGIDFEPNYSEERLARCTLKNCLIASNGGAGISAALGALNEQSLPLDIRIENCTVAGNFCSLFIIGAGKTRGRIDFVGNTLRGLRLIPACSPVKITVR